MTMIRVLLVDDHTILREELRALLSCYNDVQVVGEAKNGAVALEQIQTLKPDVVIMDIAMPAVDGLKFTRCIHQMYPEMRVLVLTQYADKEYILPLLQAGVSGFILKQAVGTDLIAAIRVLVRGEAFLCPSIATIVSEEIADLSRRKRQEIS